MKNLLTTILAIVIAVLVWFYADSGDDSQTRIKDQVQAQEQAKSPKEAPAQEQAKSPDKAPAQTKAPTPAPEVARETAREKTPDRTPTATATKPPTNRRAPTEPKAVVVTLPGGHREDITKTLERIAKGVKFPHRNDGSVFGNYEKRLPRKSRGYYREYVHPTPRKRGPGARRIVKGKRGEIYYTHDHYETFVRVRMQ